MEQKEGFWITTDKSLFDLSTIHDFLSNSYWAKGRDMQTVRSTIEHSLCFGLFDGNRQIGFARVITDYTTFGYIADVFILPEYQGKGLGSYLMENILGSPQLKKIKRFMLATSDAHTFYQKFGFKKLQNPEIYMEMRR
ncbi:MAG: GNAT family N-acetyltransferase [Calditrichaeota bacterium]|nr:GNAT family N-acetyltransferase [Calditrichota bacterium]